MIETFPVEMKKRKALYESLVPVPLENLDEVIRTVSGSVTKITLF